MFHFAEKAGKACAGDQPWAGVYHSCAWGRPDPENVVRATGAPRDFRSAHHGRGARGGGRRSESAWQWERPPGQILGTMDPVSVAGAAGLLGATSLLATFVPARAARIDPMESMRGE